jgi:hypothetical protein
VGILAFGGERDDETKVTRNDAELFAHSEKEGTMKHDEVEVEVGTGDVIGVGERLLPPATSLDPHADLSQQERDEIDSENVADFVVENECGDEPYEERREIWLTTRNK